MQLLRALRPSNARRFASSAAMTIRTNTAEGRRWAKHQARVIRWREDQSGAFGALPKDRGREIPRSARTSSLTYTAENWTLSGMTSTMRCCELSGAGRISGFRSLSFVRRSTSMSFPSHKRCHTMARSSGACSQLLMSFLACSGEILVAAAFAGAPPLAPDQQIARMRGPRIPRRQGATCEKRIHAQTVSSSLTWSGAADEARRRAAERGRRPHKTTPGHSTRSPTLLLRTAPTRRPSVRSLKLTLRWSYRRPPSLAGG